MIRLLTKLILIIWTSPNSLIGLVVGSVGLLTGGRVQVKEGCLEFYGGVVESGLERLNVIGMTLGHTILGQTENGLRIVRNHEQVHVRQYERWGPFFFTSLSWCVCLALDAGQRSLPAESLRSRSLCDRRSGESGL